MRDYHRPEIPVLAKNNSILCRRPWRQLIRIATLDPMASFRSTTRVSQFETVMCQLLVCRRQGLVETSARFLFPIRLNRTKTGRSPDIYTWSSPSWIAVTGLESQEVHYRLISASKAAIFLCDASLSEGVLIFMLIIIISYK
jgi:hypothetical protein